MAFLCMPTIPPMRFPFFAAVPLLLLLAACKNDSGVQEIRNDGPNASMVRNPATADYPTDTNQLARIVYEEQEFDFGEAKEGDIVEHSFKFTNIGKVPLLIFGARSSCGCTVPKWPEEPIPPGGTGEISAKFNTEGKQNDQRKMIRVTANTYPNETSVTLHGVVKPKG